MADTKVKKNEHQYMALLYKEGKTLAYIGEKYGITRERVRQILKSNGVTKNDRFKPIVSSAEEYKARRKVIFEKCKAERDLQLITCEWYARRIFSGGANGTALVAKAIQNGHLLHPSNYKCSDCGIKASEYDHRDYNKPLDVQPVCRGCNARRFQAKPLHGYVEKMVSMGFRPFTYRIHMLRLAKVFNFEIQDIHLIPKTLTVEHWVKHWPELAEAA